MAAAAADRSAGGAAPGCTAGAPAQPARSVSATNRRERWRIDLTFW
jgi:hypothetical protein